MCHAKPCRRNTRTPQVGGDRYLLTAAFTNSHDHGRGIGTRVPMHMLETEYQRHYAWNQWGKSFIAHPAEIGALGPWLTLAHMIWTEESDLALLHAHGVGIAHNPSSNLRLRSGIAPIPAYELIDFCLIRPHLA